MSHPQLDNLARIGKLKTGPLAENELQGLVRSGTRRLDDAARDDLSLESRFDLAYNAVHALALAALRFHGYRSGSRYLVFQCLQHTLDLPAEQWRVLDQAHRKRNLAEYEGERRCGLAAGAFGAARNRGLGGCQLLHRANPPTA